MKAKLEVSLSTTEFRYAMVNRPVGISCNPKDGLVGVEDRPARGKDHYDMARNGVAVYSRKLTDHETKQFEMSFMADGKDRVEIAKDAAEDMRSYAKQYLRIYEKDKDQFESRVYQALKESAKGYVPSVGDMSKFADLVAANLK